MLISDDENSDDKIVMSLSDKKISNLKNQVSEVTENMKINLDKVIERGQNINELNDRSESLGVAGDLFSKRSRNLRKSMWLRTCRSRLYLSIFVGFMALVVISRN